MIRIPTIGIVYLIAMAAPAAAQGVGPPVDLLPPAPSAPATSPLQSRTQPMIAAAPSPVAPVPLAPVQPMFTYALFPGHWQLDGARYVWVLPDETPRPVAYWRLVMGQYVWRGGAWVWVPAHWQ
jgi:hypothetical protein